MEGHLIFTDSYYVKNPKKVKNPEKGKKSKKKTQKTAFTEFFLILLQTS